MKYYHNGKMIGMTYKNEFRRWVTSTIHKFKNTNSYAIQKWLFDKLKENSKIEIIRFIETDTEKEFLASKETWVKQGIQDNRGSGDQIFLNISYMLEIDWKKERKNVSKM